MTMEYIRRTYDVPAKRGMRVLVDATRRLGVITSSRGPHLMVRLLGHRNPRPYHPNDLKYDDESPLLMWHTCEVSNECEACDIAASRSTGSADVGEDHG